MDHEDREILTAGVGLVLIGCGLPVLIFVAGLWAVARILGWG